MTTKPLTGRKVLGITLAAFGTIFAANMALVYAAVGSFPGLEVKNTYVTSQSFDKERAGQERLGWHVSTGYQDGKLSFSILNADGKPAELASLKASVGRATHANSDTLLDLDPSQASHLASLNLDPGKWELRLSAKAKDGTPFRQRLPIHVKP